MTILKKLIFLGFCLYLGISYPTKAGNLNYSAGKDSLASKLLKKPVRQLIATRLTSAKPLIDGSLNDSCWTQGVWAGDFTQWVPNEGAKPTYPTELKIIYDDKNIYIAIRAYDKEPGKIRIKGGARDEVAGDVVGVCFDSYHDHRTGFEFDVTARGQKIDAILTNPYNADFNWNAVWFVHTAVEDSAWTAEIEIPLNQLRYSGDVEQVWGLHCWRWIERLQEESDWEVQSSTGPGMLYLFGELHGINHLPHNHRFEMMPYTLGKLNTHRKDLNNPFMAKGHESYANLGLDAKIGVSSNFTVDLTVNPDFGQVESDPSIMNLTAYEQFFSEKRPFFLEGKNIFNFDIDDASLFYSRRIGHVPTYKPDDKDGVYLKSEDKTSIITAEKFSGKSANGLSVGVLQSFTSNEDVKLKGVDGDKRLLAEPFSSYMVGRVQHDYNQSNTVIGGIVTSVNRFYNAQHLNFMPKDAYTGGLDLLHQWHDKEFFLDAKIIGSNVSGDPQAIIDLQQSSARYYQRPDAHHIHLDSTLTKLNGFGGRLKIGKGSKGLWRYSSEFNFRSPGLELNDLGFMQNADVIKQNSSVSYFVNKPVSIFRTYSIGIYQINNWNFNLEHLSSGIGSDIYLEFLNKWAVANSFYFNSKALDTHILRGGNAMNMPATFNEFFYWRTDYSRGLCFDFQASASVSENTTAQSLNVRPGITIRPYSALKISANVAYTKNMDRLQYVDTKDVNGLKSYILARINQQTINATFRADFNISPELSLQYYGSPFATIGKYSEYKSINNPKAPNLSGRYISLTPTIDADGNYIIDEFQDQKRVYELDKPDFNFYQFRSNLVFRWEYRPGSQLYLVWSSERTFSDYTGYSLGNVVSKLTKTFPQNVFLIKFNYWFSI